MLVLQEFQRRKKATLAGRGINEERERDFFASPHLELAGLGCTSFALCYLKEHLCISCEKAGTLLWAFVLDFVPRHGQIASAWWRAREFSFINTANGLYLLD